MANKRTVVDIHIHIFNQICGRNSHGPTSSLPFGRVKTGGGELQFMPPYSSETSFPAEVIVEWMDFVGISKAVLLQNPLIGIVNDVVAKAIKEYPERFIGTIQVDPLDPGAVATIKKYSANPRHNILKFEMSNWGWFKRGLSLLPSFGLAQGRGSRGRSGKNTLGKRYPRYLKAFHL